MANINFDKQYKVLLNAAIQMGDWFLSLPQLTEQDKVAVQSVQQVLYKLPKIKDGTLAMYGFSFESGTEQQGLVRGWDVSIEYFAQDPEQQGGLEIFSSYLPIPESTDAEVLAIKKQNEVYFCWQVDHAPPFCDKREMEQWQSAVQQPSAQVANADRLRIELVYQDYYSEILIPIDALQS